MENQNQPQRHKLKKPYSKSTNYSSSQIYDQPPPGFSPSKSNANSNPLFEGDGGGASWDDIISGKQAATITSGNLVKKIKSVEDIPIVGKSFSIKGEFSKSVETFQKPTVHKNDAKAKVYWYYRRKELKAMKNYIKSLSSGAVPDLSNQQMQSHTPPLKNSPSKIPNNVKAPKTTGQIKKPPQRSLLQQIEQEQQLLQQNHRDLLEKHRQNSIAQDKIKSNQIEINSPTKTALTDTDKEEDIPPPLVDELSHSDMENTSEETRPMIDEGSTLESSEIEQHTSEDHSEQEIFDNTLIQPESSTEQTQFLGATETEFPFKSEPPNPQVQEETSALNDKKPEPLARNDKAPKPSVLNTSDKEQVKIITETQENTKVIQPTKQKKKPVKSSEQLIPSSHKKQKIKQPSKKETPKVNPISTPSPTTTNTNISKRSRKLKNIETEKSPTTTASTNGTTNTPPNKIMIISSILVGIMVLALYRFLN